MNTRTLGPCLVCGSAAIGINFTVPTCMPCKAFFRRNAVKLGRVNFICSGNGNCPVTYESRRNCNCCRLAKCFRVGMDESLIRTKAEKEGWKEIVQQNREKRIQLTISQKSHLIRPSTIYRLAQQGPKDLLISDQALLTNIFGAYKYSYSLAYDGECPSFPRVEHLFMHSFYNEYEERHKVFIDYCKLVPEFNRLSHDDKKHLLQNHLIETFVIGHRIIEKFISPSLLTSLENIYEPAMAKPFRQITRRLTPYANDPVLLKLVFIIQILSTGNKRYNERTKGTRLPDDPLLIFAGQNVYVEVLWRYLLSRLPSEQHAVKLFNQLILDLLFLQHASFIAENHISTSHNEINQMTSLMQSLCPVKDEEVTSVMKIIV